MVFAISQVVLYYAVKYVLNNLDPMKDKKKEAKAKSEQVLGKLGVSIIIVILFSSIIIEYFD